MDNLSRLVDASYPMQFGNQKYDASQLTDRDFEDLKLYIKAVYLKNARLMTVDMDVDGRKEYLAAALTQAMSIEWGDDIANEIIFTRDGIAQMSFQMIKKRHPNITFINFLKHFDGTIAVKQKIIKEEDKSQFLSESLNTTMLAWNELHTTESNEEDGDQGGSSTESSKSGEERDS